MANKGLLIALSISAITIIGIVAVVLIIGGLWLWRSSGKQTPSLAGTKVGNSKGSAVTKTIGRDGGSVSSADGRITVTVLPNSVTDNKEFSIQALSNMAQGGLGDAYRLEPSGRTFSRPVNVAFQFNDEDVAGSTPDLLLIAFQDQSGIWQPVKIKRIDQASKTLTVSTDHFTDWSILKRFKIEPSNAHVRVGQSIYLEITGCDPPEQSLFDKLLNRPAPAYGDVGGCVVGVFFDQRVAFDTDWYTDIGQVETRKRRVKYTAPPTKPNPNVATVSLPYRIPDYEAGTPRRGQFTAHITIEGGYKASGQDGPIVYSGTVCNLAVPFKVTGKHPLIFFPISFKPSSPTNGTFEYAVTRGLLHFAGSGTYTVQGPDTDNPVILCSETSKAYGPLGIGSSGSGGAHIKLTPIQGNECDGK